MIATVTLGKVDQKESLGIHIAEKSPGKGAGKGGVVGRILNSSKFSSIGMVEFDVEPGKSVLVVPCTFAAGVSLPYVLSVYSTQKDLNVTPLSV